MCTEGLWRELLSLLPFAQVWLLAPPQSKADRHITDTPHTHRHTQHIPHIPGGRKVFLPWEEKVGRGCFFFFSHQYPINCTSWYAGAAWHLFCHNTLGGEGLSILILRRRKLRLRENRTLSNSDPCRFKAQTDSVGCLRVCALANATCCKRLMKERWYLGTQSQAS